MSQHCSIQSTSLWIDPVLDLYFVKSADLFTVHFMIKQTCYSTWLRGITQDRSVSICRRNDGFLFNSNSKNRMYAFINGMLCQHTFFFTSILNWIVVCDFGIMETELQISKESFCVQQIFFHKTIQLLQEPSVLFLESSSRFHDYMRLVS